MTSHERWLHDWGPMPSEFHPLCPLPALLLKHSNVTDHSPMSPSHLVDCQLDDLCHYYLDFCVGSSVFPYPYNKEMPPSHPSSWKFTIAKAYFGVSPSPSLPDDETLSSPMGSAISSPIWEKNIKSSQWCYATGISSRQVGLNTCALTSKLLCFTSVLASFIWQNKL